MDYFNKSYDKTFVISESDVKPLLLEPINGNIGDFKVDMDSLFGGLERFKNNYIKFGEREPTNQPNINFKKISHFVRDIVVDDQIYVTIRTVTGKHGMLLSDLFREEEAKSMSHQIKLSLRTIGKMEDGVFFTEEIVAFDLILPTNINNLFTTC